MIDYLKYGYQDYEATLHIDNLSLLNSHINT